MECGKCRSMNDADARYCVNCGFSLSGDGAAAVATKSRVWRYLLLLLPVLAVAAGIGYYKFFLPQGVAAVVNGEEISLAEVDAGVRDLLNGKDLPDDARGRMRYAVLSQMITERLAWQEARKAGAAASPDEVNAAIERSRSASGLDGAGFETRVIERYGSMTALRSTLERQLTINRFIDEKVTAGAPDASAVSGRLDRWLRDIRGKAVVRVALAEELPAGGCGCCNGPGAVPGAGCGPRNGLQADPHQMSARAQDARKAALAYWLERNGETPAETKVRDFGCHVQVDIITKSRTAKSLRYQNGTITEM